MKKLKFIGKKKKLLELGYDFTKLEHGGYRFYSKGEHDFRVIIWEDDSVVEITLSTTDETALIFEYLKENKFKIKDRFNRLAYNKINNSIEDYEFKKHNEVAYLYQNPEFCKLKDNQDIIELNSKEYCKKFRNIILPDHVISFLKELHENKLIKIY